MKALLSAVLVSTGLVAIVGSVSLDEFKCGTNKVTTAFTFRSVKASCPKHMDEINECCHEHDECYNDQLGRGHCDKTFCGCLNHVVESYDANCDSIFKNMCRAVKLLGGSAYKRSKGKVLNGVREKRSGEGLNETFTLEVESTTEVATVRHVVEGTTAFPKETAVVPGEVPKEVRRHPSSLEKQSNREAELATLYEYWTSYTQIESLGIQCPRWHLAFLMMCLMVNFSTDVVKSLFLDIGGRALVPVLSRRRSSRRNRVRRGAARSPPRGASTGTFSSEARRVGR
ncbi:hypothetical protein L596_007869 [Steinernema carpocapsae]|uniref:Phospholipase A2 domain-containing protein n=1 Tax=Steinernema carpocapsae TaxID=34508 RepID=A0A4U5PB95_STECR|nr:hypothetical protein L596_007869 [Steinernema carpocapsae]